MSYYHYLKVTDKMGRGLYAMSDIPKNRILFQAEVLVLSPNDTLVVNTTDLQYYTFKYDDNRDCLVLGDGEIFNHSDAANVGYMLQEYMGRMVMVFYMLKDALPHEQLFINYNADVEVNTVEYVNKNLL